MYRAITNGELWNIARKVIPNYDDLGNDSLNALNSLIEHITTTEYQAHIFFNHPLSYRLQAALHAAKEKSPLEDKGKDLDQLLNELADEKYCIRKTLEEFSNYKSFYQKGKNNALPA